MPPSTKAPAAQIGELYVALTNLSVPRPDRQTDLVLPFETVRLTDEQAAPFLKTGGRTGRRTPVIVRASEYQGPVRLHPKLLSGPINRPMQPAPGTGDPRPDPPGSSHVIVQEVPEAVEPIPGSEQTAQDAADIPVRR